MENTHLTRAKFILIRSQQLKLLVTHRNHLNFVLFIHLFKNDSNIYLVSSPLNPGQYQIRVKVNGNLIPLYQHISITETMIVVSKFVLNKEIILLFISCY